MPQPPYSPDVTPSNFSFLFPQMKKPQREKFCRCGRDKTKKRAKALTGIKIDEFKNCLEQWKKCLGRSIASNGVYYKDD